MDAGGEVLASEPNGAPSEVQSARLDPATYARLVAGDDHVAVVQTARPGGDRVLIVAAGVRVTAAGVPPGQVGKPGNGKGLGLGRTGGGAASLNAVAQLSVSLVQVDTTLGMLTAPSFLPSSRWRCWCSRSASCS